MNSDRKLAIKIAIEMAHIDGWRFDEDAIPVVGEPYNPRIAKYLVMAEMAVSMVKQETQTELPKRCEMKIRDELESEKKRFLGYKSSLDRLHDARNLARIAQGITVIQSLLQYIDEGMDPVEFLKRCLKFCADDRSHPEAVKLRASYTLYLLGLEDD